MRIFFGEESNTAEGVPNKYGKASSSFFYARQDVESGLCCSLEGMRSGLHANLPQGVFLGLHWARLGLVRSRFALTHMPLTCRIS